jgi:hypothetical protein
MTGASRQTVFFANPNQLGFYALVSANIIALGRRRIGLGTVRSSLGFLCCFYLSLLSASKAALSGVVLLVIVALVSSPRRMLLACAVFGALALSSQHFIDRILLTQDRIVNDQTMEFVDERGYDRMLSHKDYLILGGGEGGYDRFNDTRLGDHELHSSFGTLLFCYGIVGLVLFLVFLKRVLEGVAWRNALLILPSLSYTIGHQGLRFTLLWVLFALFVAMKPQADSSRAMGASS